MTINFLILISCTTAILLLGLLILLRNPRVIRNRLFAYFSLSLIVWTFFNYLSDNAQSHNLFYTRMTFLGAILALLFMVLFMHRFPAEIKNKRNTTLIVFVSLGLALLPIIFTPYFISAVTEDAIITSSLYYLFLIFLVIFTYIIISLLFKQKKLVTLVSEKQQLNFVYWGIFVYAGLAIAFNVVLPVIFKDWTVSNYGPVFTLMFVTVMTYSIVKHRLFDIRFVLARSMGYILSLGIIIIISAYILFGFSSQLVEWGVNQNTRQWIYVILTIILASTYQSIKQIFDRMTKKVFYRDAYETQDLLNEFNQTIVSTIELQQLLERASSTIEKYLKPDFCDFAIRDSENDSVRLITRGQN